MVSEDPGRSKGAKSVQNWFENSLKQRLLCTSRTYWYILDRSGTQSYMTRCRFPGSPSQIPPKNIYFHLHAPKLRKAPSPSIFVGCLSPNRVHALLVLNDRICCCSPSFLGHDQDFVGCFYDGFSYTIGQKMLGLSCAKLRTNFSCLDLILIYLD